MAVVSVIEDGCIVLIFAALLKTSVEATQYSTDRNRMCYPAAAEPSMKSSSCYPLVNFTRPFCKNQGITLPSYVYRTPLYQNRKNRQANWLFDATQRLGLSKISSYLEVDVPTIKKCLQVAIIYTCHDLFPRCDRTRSVFMEQKLCRETCFEAISTCGKLYDIFYADNTARFPEVRKKYRCLLQPYRNAGDAPECYFFSNSTGTTSEWSTNADCLYLNGSSYRGNISVTSSGTPCQSWTEQCPHRHTMNKTYPELNNANNFCRNPQNSGKRPWCFTTDRKKRWEYCDIPKCIPVDGSYGNWSLTDICNVTCGDGFERWSRKCNSPEQKYGGRNCSHLGEPVQYRSCSKKPCPVNGAYTNWTLSTPCNVSCGDGVETWRRTCTNPAPKYGGHNCSVLGISTMLRNCSKTVCPVDGNYSNWTKSSPCSVTCGRGVEIWTRKCGNTLKKYGRNCSSGASFRVCEMKPCPDHIDYERIGISAGVVVFVIIVIVSCFIFIKRRQRQRTGSTYYARLNFLPRNSRAPEGTNTSADVTNPPRQTDTDSTYQNMTNDGNPIPGFSRGVVPYRRDYMNTRPSRNSWYDRLHLVRPLAMEWLRNAWGNIDGFGRHIYDVMQRAQHNNGNQTSESLYNTLERSPPVLPSQCESPPTTESYDVDDSVLY